MTCLSGRRGGEGACASDVATALHLMGVVRALTIQVEELEREKHERYRLWLDRNAKPAGPTEEDTTSTAVTPKAVEAALAQRSQALREPEAPRE